MLLAVFQDVLRAAIGHAIAILYARNGHDRARVMKLAHAHFRETDVLDLARRLQILQRAELSLHRYLWVDPVQLIEIDPVEAQPPQAAFARRLQMVRPPVFNPLVRARPLEAPFRGDDDAFRIRIQSISNDPLTDMGAVRIRRVNEIDPEFDGASHDANGLVSIRGFAPDSLAGQPHRTESEPGHEEIVADQQFAAEAGRFVVALP